MNYTDRELPEELKNFKEREINWLIITLRNWNLTVSNITTSLISQAGFKEKRLACTRTIFGCLVDQQADLINAIIRNQDSNLLDAEKFSPIVKNDFRQLIWLAGKLRYHGAPMFEGHIPVEDLRDEIILGIDLWNIGKQKKNLFLNDMISMWQSYTFREDQRLYRWIEKDNTSQLEWAWKYLSKAMPFNCYCPPKSPKEYYPLILAWLDSYDENYSSDKELMIIKMKKTWSQKKYRDNNEKYKSFYAPMTQETKDKLKEISNTKNQKIQEVLEELIDTEYNFLRNKT